MSSSGEWRDRISKIHPIKIINRIFALLIMILLVQTVLVSVDSVRDIRKISEKAVSDLLAITRHQTDDILKIMEKPSEIYTVDPLLEAAFHDLEVHDGVSAIIIEPEVKGLPEGLHSTPELVEYWIKTYKGEHKISEKIEREIRPFLPFLKAREAEEEEEHHGEGEEEEHHGEGEEEERELEMDLPEEQFDELLDKIKTEYEQIVSKPIVDIYFNKDGSFIDVYAAFKRDHKKCIGCHGYMGKRPVLVHFSKDLHQEIATEKQKGMKHLLHRAQGLLVVIVFYILSHFLLKTSLAAREEQREKMETALEASVDVLKSLRSEPRLMPFFVSSPSYLLSAATGGGDSVHWHDYRFRYAGYCLHDVSGHDIQETLLNIYATAVAGSCKINPENKQVATPAYFLSNLNRKIFQFCSETPAYSSHFLTVIKVLMDFTMKKLIVSLAGHPRPLLIRPDGSTDWVGEAGLLLGQFEVDPEGEFGFVDTTVWLAEGEILLVYSDGLMEQTNRDGVMFSKILEGQVVPKLVGKEPNEAYEVLEAELERHIGGTTYEDDISFTFFGARPISQYETCQYLFLGNGGRNSAEGENRGAMVRGLDYDGKVTEEVYKPELMYSRILDSLKSSGWHDGRIRVIKHAIEEVLTKIVVKNAGLGVERQISVGHVIYNDVLEIEINCVNHCFTEEMVTKGSGDLAANRYGSSLLVTKAVAEAVYFCETGDTCWLLFKKT